MERKGKEWLWRRIYQNELNGRDSLIPREELEKVNSDYTITKHSM